MGNTYYHNKKNDLFVELRTETGGILCVQQASIVKVLWSAFLKCFVCVTRGLSVKVTRKTAWELIEDYDIPADPIPDYIRREDHPNE